MLNVVAGTDPDDPTTAPADAQHPRRLALRAGHPRAARASGSATSRRCGSIRSGRPARPTPRRRRCSTWWTPARRSSRWARPSAAPTRRRRRPTRRPATPRQEGWMQYIDSHPELATQGFPIFSAVDVSCSQKKVAYTRADPSACPVAPAPRMTQAEIDAKRAQRVLRQAAAKTWMDTAGADHLGVDAVVYPGLLSDISLNDGGGGRASFGRRDTPGAANGIPTVVFPAGYNDHGQPINMQLLGRAWDDDKLVGMAYAFEHLRGGSRQWPRRREHGAGADLRAARDGANRPGSRSPHQHLRAAADDPEHDGRAHCRPDPPAAGQSQRQRDARQPRPAWSPTIRRSAVRTSACRAPRAGSLRAPRPAWCCNSAIRPTAPSPTPRESCPGRSFRNERRGKRRCDHEGFFRVGLPYGSRGAPGAASGRQHPGIPGPGQHVVAHRHCRQGRSLSTSS